MGPALDFGSWRSAGVLGDSHPAVVLVPEPACIHAATSSSPAHKSFACSVALQCFPGAHLCPRKATNLMLSLLWLQLACYSQMLWPLMQSVPVKTRQHLHRILPSQLLIFYVILNGLKKAWGFCEVSSKWTLFQFLS